MKKYKSIIFDCDGTLLNSKDATIRAYELMVGSKFNNEIKNKIFHQSRIDTFKMLGLSENKETIDEFNRFYRLGIKDTKFYDGILELLSILKEEGIHIGMATNRETSSAEEVLRDNGLNSYISDMVDAEQAGLPKPSGKMLDIYVTRNGLKKKETLFVGNAISDHLAAIDAGIDYAYCRWGTKDYDEKEAIILDMPKNLLSYI
ncbi:MAG: HAD family hydrolase [Ezakiella sp.]|nr:HAD family hydrolase [Ezakiella sp.]